MSHHPQSCRAGSRFWPFLRPHLISTQMYSSCFVWFGFWFLVSFLFFCSFSLLACFSVMRIQKTKVKYGLNSPGGFSPWNQWISSQVVFWTKYAIFKYVIPETQRHIPSWDTAVTAETVMKGHCAMCRVVPCCAASEPPAGSGRAGVCVRAALCRDTVQ